MNASKFLSPTSLGSFMRKLPAAALRGLASGACCFSFNFSLNAANASLLMITSPLISICFIPYSPKGTLNGMDLICLIFCVISSPATPSPLVHALMSKSFSYTNEILAPSNFGSTQYVNFSYPAPSVAFRSKSIKSSAL